jgi:hypothetical protein
METINLKQLLGDFEMLANNFPENLKPKMQSVCNEQPEYMADDLLFLSEEILS